MRYLHTLIFAVVFIGCSASESQPPTDAVNPDTVADFAATDAAPDATDAAGPPPEVCDDIGERIAGCGLHYSYPAFASTCPGLVSDGHHAALQQCAIKPCAMFRTCLDDVLGR